MPLQATSGAASYDAFGGGAAAVPNYIEDVFSTYLYTGNNTYPRQLINGIDLAGKGGLIWSKVRNISGGHFLVDTATAPSGNFFLQSDNTNALTNSTTYSYNNNGYTFQSTNENYGFDEYTFASWTFRKQPKFFDVVTYTGNGTSGRTVAHNLGSVPGCIIVKRTSGDPIEWAVYHRSLDATSPQNYYLRLNTTAARALQSGNWNDTAPTSTVFTLGDSGAVNTNGETYVAYLFAHNAGGFGLTGTDNVISCGSYTGNGSATGPTVTLGYEPQWVLVKRTDSTSSWTLSDNMRGQPVDGATAILFPNLSDAEASATTAVSPTATGFQVKTSGATYNASGGTYIYIAIRRGPMKVPTSGTSVFGLNARTGTGANATVTGGAGVSDAVIIKNRGSAVNSLFSSRLTGTGYMETSSFAAEVAAGTTILQANPWDVMDGVKVGTTSTITNASSNTFINYLFDRAPNFFDVVCYTGNYEGGGTLVQNVPHNLKAVPELMIVKRRSTIKVWAVYYGDATKYIELQSNAAAVAADGRWYSTNPTATQFTVGNDSDTNFLGEKYINYLFATCAGVSKVGSYTGNGTTQTINCGFTGGARFVLIKKTSGTGSWYVWDSARGIVSGNDSYLLLNSTAAEVTNTDYIDTYSAGFEISSTAPSEINENGGSFIFLAIA